MKIGGRMHEPAPNLHFIQRRYRVICKNADYAPGTPPLRPRVNTSAAPRRATIAA